MLWGGRLSMWGLKLWTSVTDLCKTKPIRDIFVRMLQSPGEVDTSDSEETQNALEGQNPPGTPGKTEWWGLELGFMSLRPINNKQVEENGWIEFRGGKSILSQIAILEMNDSWILVLMKNLYFNLSYHLGSYVFMLSCTRLYHILLAEWIHTSSV